MMHTLKSHESRGVEVFRSPLVDEWEFIGHAFSTRRGGVSEGNFDSLNLGRAKGEDPERVKENRRRFFETAGLAPRRVAEVRQVHGVHVVTTDDLHDDEPVAADALMTCEEGVLVAVQTADCVPVLLADPKRRAVAAVHAGRLGIAGGILVETVRRMGERYGSRPPEMLAALGPAISPARYEVGEECLPPFRARYAGWKEFCVPRGDGKWLLDLSEAVRRQLTAAGLLPERIGATGPCTFSEASRFYSYRRDGSPTGRLWSVIGIF